MPVCYAGMTRRADNQGELRVRTRRKSLATIHAIGKACGYSALDLRYIARHSVAPELAPGDGLSTLDDEQLDGLATAMKHHAMMLDIYIATGGFRDRLTQSIHSARSTALTKKDKIEENVTMEQKLNAFANKINSEVCKDLPPNSSLVHPEIKFGNLPDSEVVRSGMLPMDIALGIGGLQRGTFNVIAGPKGSSKTGTCLNFCGWAQQRGNMPVFYFDSEATVTAKMLHSVGLDKDKMLISNTSKLDVLSSMLRYINEEFTNAFIVIDSLPSYQAPATYNKDDIKDSARLGAEASMWNEILGRLVDDLSASRNTVLAVNQYRKNMNVINKYSPREVPWGTDRIGYVAQTYILTRAPKTYKGIDANTGQERIMDMDLRFTLDKNKAAYHGVRFEIPVSTTTGINHEGTVIEYVKNIPDEENFLLIPGKRFDEKKGALVNSNGSFCAFPLHRKEVVDFLTSRGVEVDPEAAFYQWKSAEWDNVTLEEWLRQSPDFVYWVEQQILTDVLTRQAQELAGEGVDLAGSGG